MSLKKLITIVCAIILIPVFVLAWPTGWSSVGLLYTSDGSGSCVSTTKGVYTARHVGNGGSQPLNFRIIKVYKKVDLAKIELAMPQDLARVEIAKYIDPDKPVYCVGWVMGGRQKIVIRGHIAGMVSKRMAMTYDKGFGDIEGAILVDSHLVSGMSGGGCFQDGKLIGINSLGFYNTRIGGVMYSLVVPMPGIKWKK